MVRLLPGVLAQQDQIALALLACEVERAKATIQAGDPLADKDLARLQKLLAQFGMTPASRTRAPADTSRSTDGGGLGLKIV